MAVAKPRNTKEAAKVEKRLRKMYPQMFDESGVLKKKYAGKKKTRRQREQDARLAKWY